MTDTATAPYRLPRRIGLAEAVQRCARKFVTFSGRTPLAEFWKFALAILLALVVLIGPRVMWAAVSGPNRLSFTITGPLGLTIALICIGAWIALIVTLSRRGTPGPNRFGPNPVEVSK